MLARCAQASRYLARCVIFRSYWQRGISDKLLIRKSEIPMARVLSCRKRKGAMRTSTFISEPPFQPDHRAIIPVELADETIAVAVEEIEACLQPDVVA